MMRTVLVTGVSRLLGGRVAGALASRGGMSVIGVDVVAPPEPIPGISFVRADIRNPVIARIMGDAGVDTVVHLGAISTPRQAGGRSTMKEINVLGTMQLLAACQRTPAVRHLVVKSTAAVYGSGPKDPALFTEEMEPRHRPTSGWAKDSVEVETYVRGFGRRRPEVSVTMLRFANIIGPRMRTGITDYFRLPVVPTVLGFDPRMQFVHEDDAVAVTEGAVAEPVRGTFNIAGAGIVLLSQALRVAGRPSIPLPAGLLPLAGRTLSGGRRVDLSPEVMRYLTYGRGLDTTAAEASLRVLPTMTTLDALVSFAQTLGEGVSHERAGDVAGRRTEEVRGD
jgi:UDP-glucose 4-epimerase